MKNLLVSLSLLGLLLIPAQGALAWGGCGCNKAEVVKPACGCMSRLNPLPYLGIGQSPYKYSLNPFKGFKNCNQCAMQKCNTCDKCTGAAAPICPTCQKAFPDKPCPSCQKVILKPACPCHKTIKY